MKFRRLTFTLASLSILTSIVGSGFALWYFGNQHSPSATMALAQTNAVVSGSLNPEIVLGRMAIDISHSNVSGIVFSASYTEDTFSEIAGSTGTTVFNSYDLTFSLTSSFSVGDSTKANLTTYLKMSAAVISSTAEYTSDSNYKSFSLDKTNGYVPLTISDISINTSGKVYVTPLFSFAKSVTSVNDVLALQEVVSNTSLGFNFNVISVNGKI
ncbi:MAG: hypothetical protein WCR67_04195 [Bacilli bacterium]